MADEEDVDYLKRYTTLPVLFGILEKGRIGLSDPTGWEDKNDAAALEAYRSIKGQDRVRVLCLAYGLEQITHWNTYAKGPLGCCIAFKTNDLLERIKSTGSILYRQVEYIPLEDLALKGRNTDDFPFIKRRAYESEKEYRLVWTGKEGDTAPDMDIKDCIDYVTLSPDFPPGLADVEELLKAKGVKVKHSRVKDSDQWAGKFRAAAKAR